jgi:hypothetical protein
VRDLGPEPGAEPAPADADVDLAPPPLPEDDETAPATALDDEEDEPEDEEKRAGEASTDGADNHNGAALSTRKRSKAPAGETQSGKQRSKRPAAAAAAEAAETANGLESAADGAVAKEGDAAAGSAAAAEDDAVVEVVVPHRAINWVFTRLSHVARRYNGERRECVFKFFAAMSVCFASLLVIITTLHMLCVQALF